MTEQKRPKMPKSMLSFTLTQTTVKNGYATATLERREDGFVVWGAGAHFKDPMLNLLHRVPLGVPGTEKDDEAVERVFNAYADEVYALLSGPEPAHVARGEWETDVL